ncbi:MAG TPA: hypothetical protein PK530_05025, partial [Anaerolineales bacterium]|nr:hypothetical protein [Anaerolineales bacterium]
PTPSPIPITAEDIYLPGTQPNTLTDDLLPVSDCRWCHSNYGQQHAEPYFTWMGSMMSQSTRDPVFWAAVAVANQDVEGAGTFCLRCHAPNAWLNGRTAPDGSQLTENDYDGIQCHFCHRMVDHTNVTGIGIPRDADIIAALGDAVPPVFGAGMYVIDPEDERRGPWTLQNEGWYVPDCTPALTCGQGNPHRPLDWPWNSDFHKASELCGVCHDLLNPVYSGNQTDGFAVDPVGQANPDPGSGFPEQRTYTEWLLSDYATDAGVYAPQFNPALPDGIIHSCQDCHMASATDASAAMERSPVPCRLADGVSPCPNLVTHDLVPVHDLTGSNTWVLETLKIHPVFSDTVDIDALDAGIIRAEAMLQKAATITATLDANTLSVRVINETGHKLPTGYPEGRQMWLEVTAYDLAGNVVYHSGDYDQATGTLIQDADLAWFGTWQGLSEEWAAALGVDPTSYHFHLALNNEVQFDNRIPPRGYNYDEFLAASIAPVGATYADGQYWADVQYTLPEGVATVTITLHYQLASRSYIEFLKDTNFTNENGNILYDLWTQTNMSPPENMATRVLGTVYRLFIPITRQTNP